MTWRRLLAAAVAGCLGCQGGSFQVGSLLPELPADCMVGAWCWENPLPQGNAIAAAWGAADDDVWAVGAAGTVLHWNGRAWTELEQPLGSVGLLYWSSVFGSGATDVWLGGWNSDLLTGVVTGALVRWNGRSFERHVLPEPVRSLWVAGPRDAWAVGSMSVFRWDGAAWQVVPELFDPTSQLRVVWGAGPSDVWFLAADRLWRFDGGTYAEVALPQGTGELSALHGSSRSDVWIAHAGGLLRWNGALLEVWPSPGGLAGPHRALQVASATDAWALGSKLHRWDGRQWFEVPGLEALGQPSALHLQGQSLWAFGGAGQLLRLRAGGWEVLSRGSVENLTDVWGTSPEALWAVSQQGQVLRRIEGAWHEVFRAAGPLRAVAGSAADDAWAVGDGGLAAHWDGSTWKAFPTGTSRRLLGVWAVSASDVWACGEAGTLIRWSQGAWQRVDGGGTANLHGLWGSKANDLWAVGDLGTTLHWNGQQWAAVATGTGASLVAVHGTGERDVWAVGQITLRWDGTRWNELPAPFPGMSWVAVWAQRPDAVWLAGMLGLIFRWDGAALVREPTRTLQWGRGLVGLRDDVWVAGSQGAILRRRGR